ncbi:Gfo/Idh/MocA family protein [Martelella endophytica]|uniref:Oxidoreductase n=1 Tax=Martelella endophytica TaxID=1486262 RepID=A0A0D5LWQ1_MAREN|nr:Gfo/Idh/MocA family oxidoreductase [Martelella endophytica]AJY48227.1 oxidoreductase [Martelella endophytica]
MVDKLRWGILATGGIAGRFVTDLIASGLDVRAVGSRSQEKANAFAERFGIANAHASYEALVADPEVDIIYVATPHPQHAACAAMALEAGKHVLVEKPFTLNATEAEAIATLAQEKNLVLLEAMWTRFLPNMRRIHEIIDAGTIGELRSLHAEHRQFLPSDPLHRLNAIDLGGGALLDLGIYPVSFAFDLFGAPEKVTATARFRDTGVDAEIAVVMQHGGNVMSTSVSALDCAGPNTAVIYGSKARIEIATVWYIPTTFRVVDYTGNVLEEYTERVEGRGMQFQAFEMERLVRAGERETALMPIDQTVAIMRTLDDIRRQIGLVYPSERS